MVLAQHRFGSPGGRPVVCLHGLAGHGGRFRRLAAELPGCDVIAPDLRGHGDSTWLPPWGEAQHVRDLADTADSLGLERAIWIGHSFGGRLVAALAERRPDLVGEAVLLDPALQVDPSVAAERAAGLLVDTSFGSPDEAVDARLSDGSLLQTPRAVLEDEADAHLRLNADGRYRWRFSRAAAIGAWSVMAAASPPLPSCPTLVVLGAGSWLPVTLPDSAPNITTVTVAGGHSVLWDSFSETTDAIRAFVADG